MKWQLDENKGDILYEVESDRLILRVNPAFMSRIQSYISGGSDGEGDFYHIKLDDATVPSDLNAFTSIRTLKEIEKGRSDLDDRYLRKDINDTAHGFVTFDAGWMTHAPVRSAIYNLGWEEEDPKGFYITETGTGWFSGLNVRGPILGDNIFGSPYFASGWTGFGTQLDFPKSYLELDNLLVRKSLKVYELVVNQIRGTNGSLAVTDTNKIETVEDMGSVWRCTIDDMDGEMYMNLRAGDVIRCQTWEQNSGRYYMGVIDRVGDKWFDLRKTMLEGDDIPTVGDTVVRWSNLTDEDRKGLLYLTSSDSYNPYLDVRYGDWNATVGSIKARLGRLDGINDPAFPELYKAHNNFGLYTNNFYGTGELILRSTGESVSRMFEVLKDSITMGLGEIRDEFTVSQDSILSNPIFNDGTTAWNFTNVFSPWIINGSTLKVSNRPFTHFVSGAVLINDPVNNRTVLQIADTTVTQLHENFAIDVEEVDGDYMLSFRYRSLLNFGTLEIGIPGSEVYKMIPLTQDNEYLRVDIPGVWDGTGDFIIKVTGGVVNITDISFTEDGLANAINKIRVEYDTRLTFYTEKAVMNSFRAEYDAFNVEVRRDYATQLWTYNKIQSEVGLIVDGKLTNYSTITQTSNMISNAVYNLNLGQYATTTWTSTQITNAVSGKTTWGEVKSKLEQTAEAFTINVTHIHEDISGITNAFYKFDSTKMSLNRRIEVGTGDKGTFVCQGGISPNDGIGVFLWAGSSYYNATLNWANVLIRHNGSGFLGKGAISWGVDGDCSFKSATSGSRFEIGSNGLLNMYNSSGLLCMKMHYEAHAGFISMYDTTNNLDAYYSPFVIRLRNNGVIGFEVTGTGIVRVNPTSFVDKPYIGSYPAGTLYRDGETVKIKL